MKITLISPDKKQYKANLHGHSTLSDGKLAPEALRDAYKAHGYSILAITDHERPHSHKALSQPDFILLTGYECYIRPDQQARYNPYGKEVHLNLFARDPDNTTMICFNAPYLKYVQRDNAFDEITARAGSERPREFTRAYINEYIRTARENGYLVAYNHPYWSMDDEADILGYEGLFSLEICNYNSYVLNGLEHNGALYDKLLQSGRRIYCHGADDNHNDFPFDHPMNDAFGGFTMVMPEDFTYGSVIAAMEKGEMYASMGPVFSELTVEDGMLHVACSGVSSIFVYDGGKNCLCMHAHPGETLTGGDFTLNKNARYIRVSIRDAQGRWADTRGYFREEIGMEAL